MTADPRLIAATEWIQNISFPAIAALIPFTERSSTDPEQNETCNRWFLSFS